MQVVDTHAHLDLDEFAGDRESVVARARQAGVHATVLIGFDPERWVTTAELCTRYPNLRRAVGVHPNSASLWSDRVARALDEEVTRTRPLAIGEIGLDFYRNRAGHDTQQTVFVSQMEMAQLHELPVIIHQRAAEDETLSVLQRFAPLRGVMHCFGGDIAFAERCLSLGLHLGIGGVVTYPKSHALREALTNVPLDRIVVETDAPFLAPQPWRGKRNEPAYLSAVITTLAHVLQRSEDEIAELTTRNAICLFGSALADALEKGPLLASCA